MLPKWRKMEKILIWIKSGHKMSIGKNKELFGIFLAFVKVFNSQTCLNV